jgi:hypothetical protein
MNYLSSTHIPPLGFIDFNFIGLKFTPEHIDFDLQSSAEPRKGFRRVFDTPSQAFQCLADGKCPKMLELTPEIKRKKFVIRMPFYRHQRLGRRPGKPRLVGPTRIP